MSLNEIKSVFDYCIENKMPYCYGANNFEKIDLPEDYIFSPRDEDGNIHRPYEIRGFDCSGLLYYISNGTLPHCTNGLDREGQEILKFEYEKEYSKEEKEKELKKLKDTDYLVYRHRKDRTEVSGSGHVIVSYNSGFIEFKGKDYGCIYTDKEHSMERLDSMIVASKKSKSDLLGKRWHPYYSEVNTTSYPDSSCC